MTRPRLLGIAGALRAGSTNRKLVHEAARLFGPAEFTEADLRLPLYDGDLEARGIPAEVTQLADQIAAADAIVISTPEYNSALPGVLKNALDWVSRTGMPVWQDKPVAIVSAAAGRTGGARAQSSLRLAVTPFRPRLLTGPEVMIANSGNAFDDQGRLIDETSVEVLGALMTALRAETARLAVAA
ncbi:MAG: NADPH-dependent FMN reductase [Albidovulum sp.]|uniref:NADPH-dependent FMN reductase n=1 Tax=Albidovulum sp. TaxID=1872424 RepID=UPI003CBE674C